MYCANCGFKIKFNNSLICTNCGCIVNNNNNVKNSKNKSKAIAIILALLLGGIGIHKFYLEDYFLGIMYILFCWTFIPAFVALIEVIVLLCMSEETFDKKYN